MFSIINDWNPKQTRLKSIINKQQNFDEALELCLDLHSIVHLSEVSGRKDITFIEEVLENVSDEGFKNIGLQDKGRTMAYNIWQSHV